MSLRLLAIALLLACAGSPLAQAAPPRSDQIGHPCKADFDKFCAGKVVCGKGACHDCLNAHMDRLDKACAAAMHKWDEKQETKLGQP